MLRMFRHRRLEPLTEYTPEEYQFNPAYEGRETICYISNRALYVIGKVCDLFGVKENSALNICVEAFENFLVESTFLEYEEYKNMLVTSTVNFYTDGKIVYKAIDYIHGVHHEIRKVITDKEIKLSYTVRGLGATKTSAIMFEGREALDVIWGTKPIFDRANKIGPDGEKVEKFDFGWFSDVGPTI